jgi:ABC-type uncharacterized transport system auxiliary subunit
VVDTYIAGPITLKLRSLRLPYYINFNYNVKQNKMKKVIAIFAIAATLVACGGKGTNEATTDSTTVAVDSTVVNADTTAAPVADTTSVVK